MMLSKVISYRKRQELLSILKSGSPTRDKRLWLVGFLKYVGYSEIDVCHIIDKTNTWLNYSPEITSNQVHSIFISGHKAKGAGTRPQAGAPEALQSDNASLSSHVAMNTGFDYCGFNPQHVKEIISEIDINGANGHNHQDKPGFSMNCALCMRPKCLER